MKKRFLLGMLLLSSFSCFSQTQGIPSVTDDSLQLISLKTQLPFLQDTTLKFNFIPSKGLSASKWDNMPILKPHFKESTIPTYKTNPAIDPKMLKKIEQK